jgi:Spy/CpxP family protein refolding chaperone
MLKAVGKPLLALAAMAIFCAAIVQTSAQEKQKKQGKKAAKGPDAVGKMVAGIDLTAEQQAKVEEIRKEFRPKLAEIQKRRNQIMTKDRRQTEKDARQAAKDAGKKGKEVKAAVDAALRLAPEEAERLAAIQKEQQALNAQIDTRVRALLTEEQKAKLPKKAAKKKTKQS